MRRLQYVLAASLFFAQRPAFASSGSDEPTSSAEDGDTSDKPKGKDASPSKAEKGAPKQSYRVGYGMAGCGVGSIVFKKNEPGPQIGAWFLNFVTWQCSVISSTNGSNCQTGPDKATADVEQEVFLTVNLAELERDAAQGGGEHLAAFAEILGCDSARSRARFGELSQSQYNRLFASSEPKVVLGNFRNAVQLDEQLAKDCTRAYSDPVADEVQLSQR